MIYLLCVVENGRVRKISEVQEDEIAEIIYNSIPKSTKV